MSVEQAMEMLQEVDPEELASEIDVEALAEFFARAGEDMNPDFSDAESTSSEWSLEDQEWLDWNNTDSDWSMNSTEEWD